jgi:hypothetical protein
MFLKPLFDMKFGEQKKIKKLPWVDTFWLILIFLKKSCHSHSTSKVFIFFPKNHNHDSNTQQNISPRAMWIFSSLTGLTCQQAPTYAIQQSYITSDTLASAQDS